MRYSTLAVAASFLTAALSTAQTTVTTISPNPALPGALIDITIQDTAGIGFVISSPCGWLEIRQGSQSGPVVGPNLFCILQPQTIGPDGSFSLQWDQLDPTGAQVPSGRYWAKSEFTNAPFGALTTRWTCFDIQAATEPAMIEGAPGLQVGMTTPFTVSAPTLPGQLYVMLFGFDAQTPIIVAGFVDLCLSAPVISLHIDSLDASGQSTIPFQFPIPNNPSLAYEAGMFQTLIIDSSTNSLVDTNALSLFIAP